MKWFTYGVANIVETLLRGFPFPTKTGLVKIGNPDRNSPVFLTGNFHLTVARVKRALQDLDAYLLIANSRGINVWCAAAGGHFTNHDVISALKTSGIEQMVDHRRVILPQLAATGIEAKAVQKRSGWRIIWGPVYAKDIRSFLKNGLVKTPEMRQVNFPWTQRIEMALMWAFPFSVVVALLAALFWRDFLLPLVTLTWFLPLAIFLAFPFYSQWIIPTKKGMRFSKYTAIFDFSRTTLILWGGFMIILVLLFKLTGSISGTTILHWGFISLVILLVLSLDLMGSTPVYKSGLHEDRFLKVVLDVDKCKGAGFCQQVCPKNVFAVDKVASMPRADACVQCGACIVQCPFDALYFKSPQGKVLDPETIRKFKLNLMGKRLVAVRRVP